MQTRKLSLLDYLRIPNPVVIGDACPTGPNTKSSKSGSVRPRALREWEDFEYDAMDLFDGGKLRGVLKQEFDLQDFSEIPELPFCKYFDENSFESLLIKWNQSVVSEALSETQRVLDQMHDPVYMVRGGQARSPYPKKRWKPDWGCVRLSQAKPQTKGKNLLPGDTKVSAKWSGKLIEAGEVEYTKKTRNWMRPISQIYSYCVRNNTRYGYIITDAELVAVRIYLGQELNPQVSFNTERSTPESVRPLTNRARDEGFLEYKVIPWADMRNEPRRNSKSMTVNLALWWLHLIAAGETDIRDEYESLRSGPVEGTQNQMPDIESIALDQVNILAFLMGGCPLGSDGLTI